MSIFKKINKNDKALSMIEVTTLSTVGYLVAKKNPDWVDDMESWYGLFQNTGEFTEVQDMYKHAIHTLIEKVTDDKFLQLQIKNAMTLLEIDFEGPKLPEIAPRYRKIIDAFMSGVKVMK